MITNAVVAAVFGLAGVGCFWAGFRGSQLSQPDARAGLRALLGIVGLWAVIQAAQMLTTDLVVATALFTGGLIIGFGTVFAWLYFCSAYTGRQFHRQPWFWVGAVILYGTLTAVKLTNPLHGQYFTAQMATEPYTRLVIEQGTLYWISFLLAYALTFLGIYLLFRLFHQAEQSTTGLSLLVAVTALPIIPKLLSGLYPTVIPELSYEPLGVAIFALGAVYFVNESFSSLEAPTRNELFEQTDNGVISIGPSGTIHEFNSRAGQILPGLGESITTRSALLDRLGIDSLSAHAEKVQLDATDGDKPRLYLVTASTLTVGPHEFGESVFLEEITTQHRHKQRLNLLERAVETINQAVIITDRSGTITYVNPAFEEITGYTANEAVGNQPSLLKSGIHDEPFYEELWTTILAGETWTGTITNQRKSGMYYTADLEISPITDAEGTSTHFVGIQTDITDEIQRNQQLTVLNRLLRHNLRNGMNVIKGNAALLDERVVDETSRSYVDAIRTRAEILVAEANKADEIQSLLGEDVSPAARYDFCSAAKSILETFEAEYPTVAFELECSVESELIADDRLDAVLSELISNAVRHNDRDELTVTVRAEPCETDATGSWVDVVVADTGSGIPSHERNIIESGRETPLEHTTGLGLWLVYWTVSLFGGEVSIRDVDGETQVRLRVLAVDDAAEADTDET